MGTSSFKWRAFIEKIDDLLSSISFYHKYIQNIYIQRKTVSAKLYLDKKFEYRCYDGRFISFADPQGANSLLRDVPPHYHHIHMSFNWPKEDGRPNVLDTSTENLNDYDLDDFEYSLTGSPFNYTFGIKPLTTFTGLKVFARFQDGRGFDPMPVEVYFARWPRLSAKIIKNDYVKSRDNIQSKYIYLAIVNPSGSCIERSVEVDPTLLSSSLKKTSVSTSWIFKKIGNKLKMILK